MQLAFCPSASLLTSFAFLVAVHMSMSFKQKLQPVSTFWVSLLFLLDSPPPLFVCCCRCCCSLVPPTSPSPPLDLCRSAPFRFHQVSAQTLQHNLLFISCSACKPVRYHGVACQPAVALVCCSSLGNSMGGGNINPVSRMTASLPVCLCSH